MLQKKIKIGVDLDGVIINKPPFVPKAFIEKLFRGDGDKTLHYRFPKSKLEQKVRILSHFWLVRPVMKKNVALIKMLASTKNIELIAISSRYDFLKKRTKQWLQKRKLEDLFKKIITNTGNKQPHFFKESIINKVKPDYFIDDDQKIINYLQKKINTTIIIAVESDNSKSLKELVNKLLA